MSERRRSLFVLLIVLGLIAGSLFAVSSRDTKLGLDLQGGVQLIFEGQPTAQQPTVTQEALQNSLDIMRERVDAFGVAEPELLLSGSNQIEVNLPGDEDADRAAQQVGSTAQLFFYDWEANILDEDCQTNPDENSSQKRQITGFYRAVQAASECEPQRDDNNSAADAPRFYAFNETSKQPLNGGTASSSREEALEDLSDAERANAEVVQVPEGILVVRDQKADADAPDPDRFWVIQDNPALGGTDIRNPEQNFDQQGGNEPIVTFDFTDRGREAFQNITREIAQRGQDNALPGTDPSVGSQHFAIVLDDELVSSPTISYIEYPDGIDGETGAEISGSFTISLRAGPGEDPRDRRAADPARADLELAGLRVARRPGARPGRAGRRRGLPDRRALPDRLLPRARRHRRARDGRLRALLLRARRADPDHAHAARHRRPDPHTGGGGRRQHRDLRAGQGGAARRPQRRPGDLRRLQEGPDRDRGRERRHVPRRLHPLHPRHGGRQGLRAHARRRRHPVALHRRARHPGDALRDARDGAAALARGARRARLEADPVRLHRPLALVLLDVGRDPARLRDRARRPGAELRDRLRGRHADHRAAGARRLRRPGAGRARRHRPRRRRDPDRRQPGAGRERRPDQRRAARPGRGPARRRTSSGTASGWRTT